MDYPKTNGGMAPPLKQLTNNQLLKTSALKVGGKMVLMRLDPVSDTTKGGLLLPDRKLSGRFVTEAATAKERPFPDSTAVVIQVGDKVQGVEVGERYLLTCPAVPIPVVDNKTEDPLAMLNYRDLHVRIQEAK
jgi:hypothetical protein